MSRRPSSRDSRLSLGFVYTAWTPRIRQVNRKQVRSPQVRQWDRLVTRTGLDTHEVRDRQRRTRRERRASSCKRPSPAPNTAPRGYPGSSPKIRAPKCPATAPRRLPAASAASMRTGTQSSHPETEKAASTGPRVNHNKLTFTERLLCQAAH